MRLGREVAFHDDRFTDDSARAAAGKYYTVTRASGALVDSVLASVPPGSRVLELGCGLENHAIDLGRSGHDVVAVDISPVAVAEMRSRVLDLGLEDRIGVEVMNAETLSFDASSFDVIVGTGILHHLDLTVALPGLSRVLAPSGVAVFLEPLGQNPVINLYRRATPRMRTPDEHPLVAADFGLARSCFAEVEVDRFTALALAAVPLRGMARFEAVLSQLERADAWMFRHSGLARALAWTAVLQLRRPLDPATGLGPA